MNIVTDWNLSMDSSPGTRLHRALPALLPALFLGLAGCATTDGVRGGGPGKAVAIKIIAFNDFHGHLAPPRQSITLNGPNGPVRVPAGGAAYFASAIAQLKAQNPNHIVVSAGDMTGASPLSSSLFLDEPTIAAMNLIGVDYNAAGNHEFDRGQNELLRLQNGGCAKFTTRTPCQVDTAFPGAHFQYLAANTVRQDGTTLFAPYGIKTFGTGRKAVRVGFIGMTLKGTADIVAKAGIAGIHFTDEAATANALIPQLRAQGADVIAILIHQGGNVTAPHGDQSCAGLTGDILPILDALDPSVDLVISGHTHKDYVCGYGRVNPSRPFLLTSAGQYGTLVTDIDISVDLRTRHVVSKRAENRIVQGAPYESASGRVDLTDLSPRYAPEPDVAALVARYAKASETFAQRVVGHVTGPISRTPNDAGEQPLGDLIADAQLAALRTTGGAQLAFMNQGGVRAELLPGEGGVVTFGALYAIQPFGNVLTVKSFTGQQLYDLLDQQFSTPGTLRILLPSANVRYSYDRSKPEGARISAFTIDGAPVDRAASYRVGMSQFLGDGGDGFAILRQGTDAYVGPVDLEALEGYFAASDPLAAPTPGRIHRLDIAP